MLAFLRLLVFGFLFLSVLYVAVSLWSRAVRARKLRREWEEGDRITDRDAYIRDGLRDYEGSFRRKLILLIYILPVAAVAVIVYVTNFM